MNKKPFGVVLMIDADNCKGNITSREHIQLFIDKLVETMGMKKKGDTIFEWFEYNDYNIKRDIVGYSVVQIISLSSITMHINEISKTIYLDVFTCGDLDDTEVSLLFSDFFKPTKMKKERTIRNAKSLN
jgi:S-adenosylmethionine/arginine decarboxylase-like enzyme